MKNAGHRGMGSFSKQSAGSVLSMSDCPDVQAPADRSSLLLFAHPIPITFFKNQFMSDVFSTGCFLTISFLSPHPPYFLLISTG